MGRCEVEAAVLVQTPIIIRFQRCPVKYHHSRYLFILWSCGGSGSPEVYFVMYLTFSIGSIGPQNAVTASTRHLHIPDDIMRPLIVANWLLTLCSHHLVITLFFTSLF